MIMSLLFTLLELFSLLFIFFVVGCVFKLGCKFIDNFEFKRKEKK